MAEIASCFVSGAFQIFTGGAFSLMLLGILIGLAVGILPGLGGPGTLALMLPFIYKMNSVEAFAFLLGMASVTNTTGDITSILFGVPGEPTTAATILDGHPMAKQGKAGRALGAALMSSLAGAVFGAFLLALSVPVVRPLVLSLRSPEFFMLSMLGLTFVAALSGESLLKGVVSAGIGLFLSTIGLCQLSGIQRYTFGQLFLWDGLGLVAATVGFFAIPEIIDLYVQRTSIANVRVGRLGSVTEGIKDTFRHWRLVISCSAIGSFLAIIPGIGAATTQWISYGHAVQVSKDKERFGKGAVEGVLGPGAANNASLGGNLITTVSFGIPTSVITAILMGAFIIQGIAPGPEMLVPEAKGGHLALTFSFVATIVVSNIITVIVCLLFLNQLIEITHVRSSLMIPFIIVLVFLGAFAEKNAFPDVFLVLLFGMLGWVMVHLDWPRPPLILGLVLGPLAENRLFLSTDNYGFSWLLHPIVLLLLAISLLGAAFPVIQKRRARLKGNQEKNSVYTAGEKVSKARVRPSWAMAFDFLIIVVFSLALYESRKFDLRTGLFPWIIGTAVFALAIADLVVDLRAGKSGKRQDHQSEAGSRLGNSVSNRRTIVILGWIIAFFIIIWLLGFAIGAAVCTFLNLRIASREKWFTSILLAVLSGAFIYLLFYLVLNIPFPTGRLLA